MANPDMMARSTIRIVMGPGLNSWETDDNAHVSKGAANYRAAEPGTVSRCNNCFHWTYKAAKDTDTMQVGVGNYKDIQMVSSGTCEIVEGVIAADGLCDFHESPSEVNSSEFTDDRKSDDGGRY